MRDRTEGLVDRSNRLMAMSVNDSASGDTLASADAFAEFTDSRVVEAQPHRAVARQGPAPTLDNHIGVRHAAALFGVGYEASRALVAAALQQLSQRARVEMADADVAYQKLAIGTLTATAEPATADWDARLARISTGETADLETAVTVTDEQGQTVTALSVCWRAGGDEKAPPQT